MMPGMLTVNNPEMFEDPEIVGKRNIIYERYWFYQRCQQSEETLSDYVDDVLKLAETCDFEDYFEPIVRDRVLFGLYNEQTKLDIIRKGGNPSLNDTIEMCKGFRRNTRSNSDDNQNAAKSWTTQVDPAEVRSDVKIEVNSDQTDVCEDIVIKVEPIEVIPYSKVNVVRSLCISSNGETPIQEQLSTKLPAQFSKRKKSAAASIAKTSSIAQKSSKKCGKQGSRNLLIARKINNLPKKRSTCSICYRLYKDLPKHMEKCKRKNQITCKFCDKTLLRRSLKRHMKRLHSDYLFVEGVFECFICHKELPTFENLKKHIRYTGSGHQLQIPSKMNTCLDCNKTFLHLWKYEKHLKEHRQCDQCHKYFPSQASFRLHSITHMTDSRFECFICGEQKPSFLGTRTHLSHVHSLKEKTGKIKNFLCPQCGMRFEYKCLLKNHLMREDHQQTSGIVKPFECDVCQKRFTQSISLTYHRRVHTGEKPFECDLCPVGTDKRFRSPMCLQEHKNMVHLKVKRYRCNICNYQCYKSNGMRKHMLVHTGNEPC